jgi:parallel beta-helix repeat protein
MYGGFPNGGGTRDIAANPTILSGDFNGNDVVTGSGSTLSITGNDENAYHVVLSVFDAATTLLDGFTVRGANANGSNSISVETLFIFQNSGGGMVNRNTSLTITNTIFTGNSAFQGGGMVNSFSSPTITNITFTGNRADNIGGGMLNEFSSPSITNTTFTGNRAPNIGGGMVNASSSPTVTNCTFSGNTASFNGGGMFNAFSSSPVITNTTFTGNSANTSGGGMRNQSSSNPIIRNCILWGNGTEISNDASTPVVSYSIIQGGHAGTGNINADPPLCKRRRPRWCR